VPVRPGPAAARILRIERAGDVRPPLRNDSRSGRRCTTGDRPHDTNEKPDDTDEKQDDPDEKPDDNDEKLDDRDDQPHDIVDLLDTAVEPRQPCVRINELVARLTSEQGSSLQVLDDHRLTAGSQQVAVKNDSLSDASNRHESAMTVST